MWIAGDGDHWGPSWIMVITGSRCSLYRFSRSPPFSVPLLSRLPQILFSLSEGLRGWTGLLLMIFFSGRSALTFVCRAIFHSSVLLHFYMSQFDFTDHLQPHLIRHSSSCILLFLLFWDDFWEGKGIERVLLYNFGTRRHSRKCLASLSSFAVSHISSVP